MFERFTPEARRTVVLAQEEARELKHKHIDVHHFLLGLLHPGGGLATQALGSKGVTLDAARGQVVSMTRRSLTKATDHLPFTPGAKVALESTLREALALRHKHIGTEHILLAITRDEGRRSFLKRADSGVARRVLIALDVEPSELRSLLLEMIPTGSTKPGGLVGSAPAEQGARKWPLRFTPKDPEEPADPQE